MTRSISLFLFLLVVLAVSAVQTVRAQENPTGPAYMFITYRCEAANRPKALDAMNSAGQSRFAELKKSGVIADYLILFNAHVDVNTWDFTIIVRFDSMGQTQRWRDMERDAPGGLTSELLKLATPLNTYYADRHWAKGSMGDQSKAIYLVIPYDYVEKGQYITYLDAYGIPQFNAWLDQKVINRYEIFLNMHATGAPWDALILFEYADASALARRDAVKMSVRAGLNKDLGWRMIQQSKQTYRTEREVSVATPVTGK